MILCTFFVCASSTGVVRIHLQTDVHLDRPEPGQMAELARFSISGTPKPFEFSIQLADGRDVLTTLQLNKTGQSKTVDVDSGNAKVLVKNRKTVSLLVSPEVKCSEIKKGFNVYYKNSFGFKPFDFFAIGKSLWKPSGGFSAI